MVQLNQNFIDSIAKDLPRHLNLDDFIHFSGQPLRLSIRINTLKISCADFIDRMTHQGWGFEPIPWCKDGFWLTLASDIQLGNTIEHLQGLFYIQEASSMLPPTALFQQFDLSRENIVLDMASAPGSKTTQIAALMENQGLLIANEYSASRIKVLHANVLRMGVTNTALTHFDARVFGEYLYESFDAILLDAPCSGEGTVRKDPEALKHWDPNNIADIAQTQKALIASAFLALKPGGSLVYSTCTLNKAENQAVCLSLKALYPDAVSIDDLSTLFPGANQACTEEGFLHVWPQIFDSEGFFVAKITKKHSIPRQQPAPKKQKNFPFNPAPKKHIDALQQYFQDTFSITLPKQGILMQRENEFWLFPESLVPFIGKMRYQRMGIKLADLLKKGFKAKHEALMALGINKPSIGLTQEQAKAYLMGRDIMLSQKEQPQGEILVSYEEALLGMAKHLGNKLKNNLPRELVKDKIALL
ncbi:16S rRNA (cytosine(1407)-C(5))-methyltransferase RsmF [Shewanella surugensis]|uniref:Ribosomal RNA small subunit methyltransferase F n=1 Tax=Shewanella surugensis TaxID=212020 RepID=A0ABT0L8F1_9GAMM|nr:16S rRNA (cytosine(1407)-C(5))-methyltransferase RsmF [Shewanella surugensis]MCL1123456.1 16S rRNA (cytosine(1407)-C(5))-methyltransferase RsmF [Shewanella surugensis]